MGHPEASKTRKSQPPSPSSRTGWISGSTRCMPVCRKENVPPSPSSSTERERTRYLASPEGRHDQANGFYARSLHLTLGRLQLKVPRVRLEPRLPPQHPSPTLETGA